MQSNTRPNGYAPMDTRKIKRSNSFSVASPQLPSFSCGNVNASRDFVVSRLARFTEHRQRTLQQRYLAASAQAYARRRRITSTLLSAFVIATCIVAGYTLQQEQRIQQVERWQ